MTIVTGINKLMSLDVRGSFGYSSGFGRISFGFSLYGLFSEFTGIYQRKKTLKGFRTSKMNFYRPTNPQTTGQQAWRSIFASGWAVYNALTTDEKLILSRKARLYRISGPNLFMRYWLQSNR